MTKGSTHNLVLVLVLVATLLVSVSVNWSWQKELLQRIDQIEQRESRKMISTTWFSGRMERTLTTRWKEHDDSELYEAFLARHTAEVEKAQNVLPPDPGLSNRVQVQGQDR